MRRSPRSRARGEKTAPTTVSCWSASSCNPTAGGAHSAIAWSSSGLPGCLPLLVSYFAPLGEYVQLLLRVAFASGLAHDADLLARVRGMDLGAAGCALGELMIFDADDVGVPGR